MGSGDLRLEGSTLSANNLMPLERENIAGTGTNMSGLNLLQTLQSAEDQMKSHLLTYATDVQSSVFATEAKILAHGNWTISCYASFVLRLSEQLLLLQGSWCMCMSMQMKFLPLAGVWCLHLLSRCLASASPMMNKDYTSNNSYEKPNFDVSTSFMDKSLLLHPSSP